MMLVLMMGRNKFRIIIQREIKPGYRSVAEGKHVIFYRVSDAGVEILGIPHSSMDIEHRLGRAKIKPRED